MARIQSTTDLIRKLNSELLRQRLVYFAAGLMAVGVVLFVVALALAAVAQVWVLAVWFKLTLLIGAGLGAAWLVYRQAIRKLFHGNVDAMALSLEAAHPGLKGRLIAAVQFSRMKLPEGYSPDLVKAVETQVLGETDQIDFGRVVTLHPLWRAGRDFAIAAIAAVLLFIVAPGFFGYALEVYSNPTTRVAPPVGYQLLAAPARPNGSSIVTSPSAAYLWASGSPTRRACTIAWPAEAGRRPNMMSRRSPDRSPRRAIHLHSE